MDKMDKDMQKTIKQAEKNAFDLARDLEHQETVVADLKRQGGDTKDAEVLEWKLRGLLHRADELVKEARANRGRYLENKVRDLSALTRAGASYSAVEKALDALALGIEKVKDRGGTDDEARAEGARQFIAAARSTGDSCLEKIADAVASFEGVE